MITAELLSKLVYSGMPSSAVAAWAVALNAAAGRYGINTPLRVAHWLAQIMHESAGLRWTREIWGPTAAQQRYERDFNSPWPSSPAEAKQDRFYRNRLAYTLGNTKKGDGCYFSGNGPIQVTGRSNTLACFAALGLPATTSPNTLSQPRYGALSAGWFWDSRNLNTIADQGAVDQVAAITLKVNGGSNGLIERQRWFNRIWAMLKDAKSVTPAVLLVPMGGGEPVAWDGKPTKYAGTLLDDALIAALRLAYPVAGGPWMYSPSLTIYLRRNGDLVLERAMNVPS